MSDTPNKTQDGIVTLKTYWQPLVGLLGLAFFFGGLNQRTASDAQLAASEAQTRALQQSVHDLVEHEREHDAAITKLTDKLDSLADVIKAQQDELHTLEKSKGTK